MLAFKAFLRHLHPLSSMVALLLAVLEAECQQGVKSFLNVIMSDYGEFGGKLDEAVAKRGNQWE
ncbi:MAG: hypothetical protein H7318_15680 [Oligoflexus sp.]|nr:hypothetical protein [Oligoflexus sp.]